MRIGLFGMPASGKSYMIDQLRKQAGTGVSEGQVAGDKASAAAFALRQDISIVEGHLDAGDELTFIEEYGPRCDAYLYLCLDGNILRERMGAAEQYEAYKVMDLRAKQIEQAKALRAFCHEHDRDFFAVDNPGVGYFEDVAEVLEFIKAVAEGYSCVGFARECADRIDALGLSKDITLSDGDKTFIAQDSSYEAFRYATKLYDGKWYSGYQSWKQAKEFAAIDINLDGFHVTRNEKTKHIDVANTVILTAGNTKVWQHIVGGKLPLCSGTPMCSDTKYFIAKFLQRKGYTVTAYGDSMSDYYMIKTADHGYLVSRPDGSISSSLEHVDLTDVEII